MSTPKFSKRHYEALANVLAVLRQSNSNADDCSERLGYGLALLDVEHDLIAIFANDNPRFDAGRFRDAAQPRNAKPFASALQGTHESEVA